jgi:anion-transporting  ArsA/GET3 family ATPase
MGLAAHGQRVAVVTIDPARRLADALGLDALGDEPARVDPARFAGHGLELRGELWAMMLDPKRTFDALIGDLAPDARAREEILGNRIYRELSSAVAGSQEFTAVAKLYELHRSGRFDVIVLDTPPSRNALDFLDAPRRITGFFDGRMARVLRASGGGLAARVLGAGTGVAFSVLQRLTGVDLLRDIGGFFRALGGVVDGLRDRAKAVDALLADPATTFLVVTSPGREAVEEAIFFRAKLREAGLPFGGLVVNRATVIADEEPDVEALEAALGPELAAKALRALEELRALAARDEAAIERLRRETGDADPVVIPQLDGDVHDVGGLVAVHRYLFAG